MKISAFKTYCLYLSIKTHFTQKKYNYFTYQGSVKATEESFNLRKDKYFFVRLSKKYEETEMIHFLVANFVKGKKWIGEFLEEDAEVNYIEYMKHKQSFSYFFENEVSYLFSIVDEPKELFKYSSGTYPVIINEYLSGKLSLETLAILNRYICFLESMDNKYGKDDIIWSKIKLLAQKILPFLEYDKHKIVGVLKKHV